MTYYIAVTINPTFLNSTNAKQSKTTPYLAAMFRKCAAYLMTILVISQIGAAWTVFSTARWIHKQNKQARLSDKSHWEEFHLSHAEYEASIVEEGEIEIQGQLYDVVSTRMQNGRYSITAVADNAENKLNKTLNGLHSDSTGWSEIAKQAQLFSTALFLPEKNLRLLNPNFALNISYFQISNNGFNKGFLRTQEQPPAA